MAYDAVLLQALIDIERAKYNPKQPAALSAIDVALLACKGDSNGRCDLGFNPTRSPEDAGMWCPHELLAMPIFKAFERISRTVIDAGVYDRFCASVFDRHGSIAHGGANLKGASRACYKIAKPKSWSCNAGNWRNVKDVLRISIEFDDLAKLYAGAKALIERLGVYGQPDRNDGVPFEGYQFGPIYRIKDRFAAPPMMLRGADGRVNPEAEVEVIYKDYQVILGLRHPLFGFAEPYLIELQLHEKHMLRAKHEGGHALYKKMRVLTPAERTVLLPLVEESNKCYGAAFTDASNGETSVLNADIDYLPPEVIDYIAQSELSAGQALSRWEDVIRTVYELPG